MNLLLIGAPLFLLVLFELLSRRKSASPAPSPRPPPLPAVITETKQSLKMKETTNRETLNGWAYHVEFSGAVEATSPNGERRAFPNWSTFWEAAHGQKKGGRGKAFAKILASVVTGIIVIGYLVGRYGGSETSTSSSPPAAVEQGSETSTSSSPPAAVEQPSSALAQYVQQGPKLVGSWQWISEPRSVCRALG